MANDPIIVVVVRNQKNGHQQDFVFDYDEPRDRILKFVEAVDLLNPFTTIWIRVR